MLVCERESNTRLVPFSEALKNAGFVVSPRQAKLAEEAVGIFGGSCSPDSFALTGAVAKNLCFGPSRIGQSLPLYFREAEKGSLANGKNGSGVFLPEEDRRIILSALRRGGGSMDVDIKFSPQNLDLPQFLRAVAYSCQGSLSLKEGCALINGGNFIIEVQSGFVRVRRETEPASRIVISIQDKKGGPPLILDLTEYVSTGPDYRGGREAPVSDLIRLPLRVSEGGSVMVGIPPLEESDRTEIVVPAGANLATLLRAWRNVVLWDLFPDKSLLGACLRDSCVERIIPPERRKDVFTYLFTLMLSSPALICLLGAYPRTNLFRFFPLNEKLEMMPRFGFLRNLRLPSGEPLFPEDFLRKVAAFSETQFRSLERGAQLDALGTLLEGALEIDRQYQEKLLRGEVSLEKSGLGIVFAALNWHRAGGNEEGKFLQELAGFLSSFIPYKYPENSSSACFALHSPLAGEVLGERAVEALIRKAAEIVEEMSKGRERFSAWVVRTGGRVCLMEIYAYKDRKSPVSLIDEDPPPATVERLTREDRVVFL